MILEKKHKKLFTIAAAILSANAIIYYAGISCTSIVTLILYTSFYLLYSKIGFLGTAKAQKCSIIGSTILSIITLSGHWAKTDMTYIAGVSKFGDTVIKGQIFDYIGSGNWAIANILCILAIGLGLIIIFYFIMLQILYNLSEKIVPPAFSSDTISGYKVFLTSWIVIFLCWLPYFLANYPGILNVDSIAQLAQTIPVNQTFKIDVEAVGRSYNLSTELSDHHPVILTLIIGFCYRIGMFITHDPISSVGFYTVIQMVIMSLSYSYAITTIYIFSKKISSVCILTAFFGLVPFHAYYSITMYKDVLFAAAGLVLTIQIYKIILRKNKKVDDILFLTSGTFFCLLRHNAIYAYILTFLMFFLYSLTPIHKTIRKNNLLYALPLVILIIFKGPVYSALGVTPISKVEMFAVPIQQISNVVFKDRNLEDSDIELIEELAPVEAIKNAYNPRHEDPVKVLVSDNFSSVLNNKAAYMGLWIRLLFKYPIDFIEAYVNLTAGFWSPEIQYLPVSWLGISDNPFGIETTPLIPDNLGEYLTNTVFNYKVIPGYALLWSIGFYFIALLVLLVIVTFQKRLFYFICFGPLIGVWLTTMISTPLFAEFRYVYMFIVTIPVLAFLVLSRIQEQTIQRENNHVN